MYSGLLFIFTNVILNTAALVISHILPGIVSHNDLQIERVITHRGEMNHNE